MIRTVISAPVSSDSTTEVSRASYTRGAPRPIGGTPAVAMIALICLEELAGSVHGLPSWLPCGWQRLGSSKVTEKPADTSAVICMSAAVLSYDAER